MRYTQQTADITTMAIFPMDRPVESNPALQALEETKLQRTEHDYSVRVYRLERGNQVVLRSFDGPDVASLKEQAAAYADGKAGHINIEAFDLTTTHAVEQIPSAWRKRWPRKLDESLTTYETRVAVDRALARERSRRIKRAHKVAFADRALYLVKQNKIAAQEAGADGEYLTIAQAVDSAMSGYARRELGKRSREDIFAELTEDFRSERRHETDRRKHNRVVTEKQAKYMRKLERIVYFLRSMGRYSKADTTYRPLEGIEHIRSNGQFVSESEPRDAGPVGENGKVVDYSPRYGVGESPEPSTNVERIDLNIVNTTDVLGELVGTWNPYRQQHTSGPRRREWKCRDASHLTPAYRAKVLFDGGRHAAESRLYQIQTVMPRYLNPRIPVC